ncbi:EamA family transporter [Nonomuraea dietziae]
MLALGGLGTGIAYLLLYWVQVRAGVTTTSTVTYLLPVFAVVSGVAVLGESLAWNQPVGAVVILVAIAMTQGLLRPVRRRVAEPAPPAPSRVEI